MKFFIPPAGNCQWQSQSCIDPIPALKPKVKMRFSLIIFLICSLSAPAIPSFGQESDFQIQGHRGSRGTMPENTIPAFEVALSAGVEVLEFDLVMSKDSVLVLSHDPWMNHEICIDPAGNFVEKDSVFNLFEMTFDEISAFDCGSRQHPRFEDQQNQPLAKPSLSQVLDFVKAWQAGDPEKEVLFNIEIKTTVTGDDIYNPKPAIFAEQLVQELTSAGVLNRTIIQSFDYRPLQYLHQKYPNVKQLMLVEEFIPLTTVLDSLGFTPDVYSPNHWQVNQKLIDEAHANHTKIIPWTVNNPIRMKALKEMGADGFITDFPALAIETVRE